MVKGSRDRQKDTQQKKIPVDNTFNVKALLTLPKEFDMSGYMRLGKAKLIEAIKNLYQAKVTKKIQQATRCKSKSWQTKD